MDAEFARICRVHLGSPALAAYDRWMTDGWVRSPAQEAAAELQKLIDAHRRADVVVRSYPGSPDEAYADYQLDAVQMIPAGWYPIAQQFVGEGPDAGRVAMLGLLAFVGSGSGVLIVTWQYQQAEAPAPPERNAPGNAAAARPGQGQAGVGDSGLDALSEKNSGS